VHGDPRSATPRAWLGCALVVLGAAVLIVGLLVLEPRATGGLAAVVAPAVALATAATLLLRETATVCRADAEDCSAR
jgi:hypothetical protein